MKSTNMAAKVIRVVFAVSVAFAAFSCNLPVDNAASSSGTPYEIITSIHQDYWDSEVGDTLRSVFGEPVQMINQYEPRFDLLRINPASLKGVFLNHRNVLIISINPEVKTPTATAQYNTYGQSQVMVSIVAPTAASMAAYISDNRAEFMALFEKAERDRAVEYNKKYGERHIEKEVYDTFGMNMSIPPTFQVKSRSENFMWIGYEWPLATQSIVIYSYPYTGRDDLRAENLLARRGDFLARIPGPSKGSYVITSEHVDPEVVYKDINGRTWAEVRGFWDVYGDFMGGPFVSYSTANPATGQMVTIEGFLYSPKKDKRNMLRTLEHLVYSVSFPDKEDME